MSETLSKVPAVTLGFWIIKIAATTLGETGGDSVTMTLDWGYLAGTALFVAVLVVLVGIQIAAKKFRPFLYWATIVASTTFGTTMADFADRSLGIGYTGGASTLFVLLMATLGLWYWMLGSISIDTVSTPKAEAFYWAAITFSQTLGTALGDWAADSTGLGYEGGALVFAGALAVVAAAYYWTNVSRVTLFWIAFILTRPLGATVGDFLDKPISHGGLDLSRPIASAVIAAFIIGCLLVLPPRAGRHSAQPVKPGNEPSSRQILPGLESFGGLGSSLARQIKSLIPSYEFAMTIAEVQTIRKAVLAAAVFLAILLFTVTGSKEVAGGELHNSIEQCGIALLLICILGRTWTSMYIAGRKIEQLVTLGPYSIVRNPLYFFSIVGAAGAGAQFGSVLAAAAFAAATWAVFRVVVSKEERLLAERYGSAFLAYTRQVPRFMPNPTLWHDEPTLTILPRKVVRTLADASLFLLWIPLAEMMEHLQTDGVLPVLLHVV